MRICKVPECDTKQYCSTGYCSKHYQQFRKYGKILERSNFDPNEFIIDGDICWIILYNVKNKEVARTRILTTYYKQIRDSKLKWHLGTGGYVIANWSDDNGYQQHIFLHEAIIQLSGQIVQPGEEIDHKDRDPLNNLDDNLRICTNTQNQQNRGKNKNNTSGHKGVHWHKSVKMWEAQIMINGKKKWLGNFVSKEAAIKAHNEAAVEYHGEFAVLDNEETTLL